MIYIATFFIPIAVFFSQPANAQQWEPFLTPPFPMFNIKLVAIEDNIFLFTTNRVTGLKIKIVDEQKTGLPEANIKISISDTTINFKADLEGNIDIKNLKTGLYQVSAVAVGCFNLSNYPVNITNNNAMIEIEMKQLDGLKSDSVEWSGGWVTLKDKQGKIISIRSKKKE